MKTEEQLKELFALYGYLPNGECNIDTLGRNIFFKKDDYHLSANIESRGGEPFWCFRLWSFQLLDENSKYRILKEIADLKEDDLVELLNLEKFL